MQLHLFLILLLSHNEEEHEEDNQNPVAETTGYERLKQP